MQLWPAVAALGLTLGQLLLIERAGPWYGAMRKLLVASLNLVRTLIASELGAAVLSQEWHTHTATAATAAAAPLHSGGGISDPSGCLDPLLTLTPLLAMRSGLGTHMLVSLLFPPPYKLFLPASLLQAAVQLWLWDPLACRAVARTFGTGTCGAAAAPHAAVSALPLWQRCELALFILHLLLGGLLPSLFLHRKELAARRSFAARQAEGQGGSDGGSNGGPAFDLHGQRWPSSAATILGVGGLVVMLWAGLRNVFLTCVYLHVWFALYLLLS